MPFLFKIPPNNFISVIINMNYVLCKRYIYKNDFIYLFYFLRVRCFRLFDICTGKEPDKGSNDLQTAFFFRYENVIFHLAHTLAEW